MIKKIIKFLIIIIFFQANQSFASDKIKSGNDGVQSLLPNTSIAKPPLKLNSFKSAEKRIIKAKKYDKKGKKKKAIKLYEEALEYLYEANKIEPLDPRILNYLGLTNKKIGKLEDAEIYLIMGLEIEPENNEMNKNLGIDFSTGSLGMGLSIGLGLSLAAKKKKKNLKVYVIIGDGEKNEVSIWKSTISAQNLILDNLFVIINKIIY